MRGFQLLSLSDLEGLTCDRYSGKTTSTYIFLFSKRKLISEEVIFSPSSLRFPDYGSAEQVAKLKGLERKKFECLLLKLSVARAASLSTLFFMTVIVPK